MSKKIPVTSLLPNPFRNLTHYPINREKVDALKDSYRDTGFWGNILARKVGNKYEIAYGHHRLVAIKEHYGKRSQIEVIVRQLTDADMIRIMARENMEEWGSNAAIESETLRATLDAYAAGRIELGTVPAKTPSSHVLYAPYVTEKKQISREHPYTRILLAQFLGWTSAKRKEPNFAFQTAFRALQLMEDGIVKERHLAGKKREEAKVLLTEASRAHRERTVEANRLDRAANQAPTAAQQATLKKKAQAARKQANKDAATVADHLSKGFKTGHISRDKAKEEARAKVRPAKLAQRSRIPDIDDLVNDVTRLASNFLNGDDNISVKVEALIKFRAHTTPAQRKRIASAFSKLSSRLTSKTTNLNKEGRKDVKAICSK